MNTPTEKSLAHITAEAAEWFTSIRGAELTPSERERFANWIEESPVHVREYLGVAEVWGILSAANAWPSASAEELIEATRAASKVVAIPADGARAATVSLPGTARFTKTRHRSGVWFLAVAAMLLIAAIAFTISLDPWHADRRYSTGLGEQRSIVLSDGSVVRVNTLSRLVVRFDDQHRRIELPEGEALFRVAHDAARPFEVVTPLATVRAVGTQFNVYSREHGTQIAVVEGRVVVSGTFPAQDAPAMGRSVSLPVLRIDLTAGEQVRVTPDVMEPPQPVDIAATTAWTQRRLAFENERIDRVIEELNRYNKRRLEVPDPELAALRVSGVFDADDPRALVQYLQRVQDVEVAIDGDVSRLTQRDR